MQSKDNKKISAKDTNSAIENRIGVYFPPIVHGTSYLGNLYRELSFTDKMELMQTWFQVTNGSVMIDSAGKYGAGLALEVLGSGLKKIGVQPEQVVISNKLGWYRIPLKSDEPTFEPGAWVNLKYDAIQTISYEGILQCWKQGFDLLGEYKPALVSVHDPDEYLLATTTTFDREKRIHDILEAYRALFELKEKGEVKGVGIGSKDWRVIKELYSQVKFDWVMFANKFTIYHHPKEIIEFMEQLEKDGVVIINSAIFNAGFLTGGQHFDYRIADSSDPKDQILFAWRDRFFEVCNEFKIAPGDACLKFAMSAPQVVSVALNPSKPHRISHNLDVLKQQFPAGFWEALKQNRIISPEYPYL